jgi:hypothetical protein
VDLDDIAETKARIRSIDQLLPTVKNWARRRALIEDRDRLINTLEANTPSKRMGRRHKRVSITRNV